MYFSDREKKILLLLLEYQEGMTQTELQTQLGVSKRTVYREIASIEKSIASLDLKVTRRRGSGFRLVGDSENIRSLQKAVSSPSEEVFTTVQRQSAIAALLLIATEETTIESLAVDFQVSVNTINKDLTDVAEGLTDYQLKLLRLKARGILIEGYEKGRRQILGNLIYQGTNEYEFFQYMESLKAKEKLPLPCNFFMKLVDTEAWYLAQKVILEEPNRIFTDVTDNQLQLLIIVLALSISRMNQGNELEEGRFQDLDGQTAELSKVLLSAAEREGQTFSEAEAVFFAQQLEGLNYKIPQNIFLESFDVELSYQVKELIRITSEISGSDFRKDEQLFYDLVAHMSAAIKRTGQLKAKITHPLLEQIVQEYRPLYQALLASTHRVFPDSDFSQDELAYIVIHFATSMERNPEIHPISILVLCSSGIGTSRILESRLRRYIRSASKIKVSRISQMSTLNFQEYDLILSTIFLPGFELPYKMISPLLLDEEIQEIKTFIHSEIISSKDQLRTEQPAITEAEPVASKGSFESLYEALRIANGLLQRFGIKAIEAQDTLAETLFSIVAPLEGVLISDVEKVSEELTRRYQLAPIGIPGTTIALFHSSNRWTKEAYFSIYDLDRSFTVLGMDKKEIELKRILLMLAPDPLFEDQQNILGKISSSIIESDLNTEIYQNGDQAAVYQLLSSLFVDEIKEVE